MHFQDSLLFQLCIICGFRRGECIALEWADIDFTNNIIHITKSTSIVNGKPYTKPPKNVTSVRDVSIPDYIADLLRQWQQDQETYKLSIGSKWAGNNYIFIQWNGSQMYPSTPYHTFKKVISRYNAEHKTEPLPEITLHGLRHTSATLLISEHVDPKTVSNRLGHAQTSTTMNIYSHALRKKDTEATNSIAALLKNKPE